MSSPSVRKQSTSPIRNLDDKSPRRNPKLQTIIEQDPYLTSNYNFRNDVLKRQNTNLNVENRVLNDRVRNYADETTRFLAENSRLRQQNQALKDWGLTSNIMSIDKLNREIFLKDAEIDKLTSDIGVLKAHYQRNLDQYRLENESLKNQLVTIQTRRFAEAQQIKQKYSAIAQQDMSLARRGYMDDISRLMANLETTKALLIQKQQQVKDLAFHGQNLVKQHSLSLQQLVSQNNVLRNKILQVELKRDQEVKQAESKKELEKSRTNGIISFCKQNTAFMERQIGKLAEELLEKSISIEQFTKDILKVKRNLEQTEKRYQQKLDRVQNNCNDKLQEKQEQLQKHEKYHKQEIADMKKVQMQLQQIISTKDHELDSLQRQNEHNKEIINAKERQITELKTNLAKIHDDHAKQISKVMTDSRVKRKSMKNLSQSSSLRDLSADGNSSIIKKPIQRQNSIVEGQEGSSGQLYTVREELAASQLVHNEDDMEEDVAMKDLVLHYENMIQDLKNNKALQLSLAHDNIQKLNQTLREKQQELLEILERFSPLMQYKLNPTSIQQERKQKIEKHYKANIDLLSVMLDKYSINAVARKK